MFWHRRSIDSVKVKLSRAELIRRSRLLVIDDERPDLIDDLTGNGFAVDYRKDINGDTLHVLHQPLYDLILLDFGNVGTTLGDDHGLTLLRLIKRIAPATIVIAYTSKALAADHADFYRLANGVLAKDAGIADSMERIEEGLKIAHSIDNVWRGLLSCAGVEPGSKVDLRWQDLAIRALENPARLDKFKTSVLTYLREDASREACSVLIDKVVEMGVKSAMESL